MAPLAMCYLSFSLCTMLCLQWEPEIIAVAVMYLAGRLCKFEIQEWSAKPIYRRWWEQFVQDVPVELLEGTVNSHRITKVMTQSEVLQPIVSAIVSFTGTVSLVSFHILS